MIHHAVNFHYTHLELEGGKRGFCHDCFFEGGFVVVKDLSVFGSDFLRIEKLSTLVAFSFSKDLRRSKACPPHSMSNFSTFPSRYA